ncbi:phenylalanine--tRNA ligase subunit beta [Thermopirellula anaerolimosa]
MKISLDWISDFVDLQGVSPQDLAERLTLATAEVEDLHFIRRYTQGVLVGRVTACEAIEGQAAGGLRRVEVDCGTRRYESVCGAPNVVPGMVSAFAPAGVTLAGETVIVEQTVAGRRSEGVLCSAAELGMSHWHEGILEIPEGIPVGTPLDALIPPEDVLIEIDNKSLTHRPDLWGHYGFAREIAVILDRPLKPLPVYDLSQFESLPPYPLEVASFDDCPCYGCIDLRFRAGVPSPLWMQRRLHALGQRTFNLAVDVTNYVMWELAQPTHAFDGDKLRKIRVASLGKEGVFVTLDGQERRMLPDDLLIWNEKEPVALAGIMGGLHSEVSRETQHVLLESANFRADRVRRTSVRLDLRTEAAQRFEKSQPPANVITAAARILQCLVLANESFEVLSRFTVAGDPDDRHRPLLMDWAQVNRMAGVPVPRDEAQRILTGLGFQVVSRQELLELGIPPHRSRRDLSIPADIVEEILRIYGYGRIEPQLPVAPLGHLPVNEGLQREHRVRRVLAGAHQFIEVQNYIWFDVRWLDELGYRPSDGLRLRNPPAQHNGTLRTTLVPNLLALVRPNRAHRDNFRLFEIGRVFRAAEQGRQERTFLAGVAYQPARSDPEELIRGIRGALEDVAMSLGGSPFRFEPATADASPWGKSGSSLVIHGSNGPVGGMGLLTGNVLKTVVPDGQVAWFEVDLEALPIAVHPAVKFSAIPVYPGSWQDFSLLWDAARGFAELESVLDRFVHRLIVRREFVYRFKGKGLPPGKASYTFRYHLAAPDHTLSADEIDAFRGEFLRHLESHQIVLR